MRIHCFQSFSKNSYASLCVSMQSSFARKMNSTKCMSDDLILMSQTDSTGGCRWNSGSSLIDMAEERNFSMCMMARLVLSCSIAADRPDLNENAVKKEVSKMMNEPRGIVCERLRNDVITAIELDSVYSPAVALVRTAIGNRYEQILMGKLQALGLSFQTEEDLRRLGMHRTPDIYLQSPIAVDGHIINWIDSKALFGDARSSGKAFQEQILAYVVRYGTGAVLFWYDYLESDVPPEGVVFWSAFPPSHRIVRL